MGTLPRKFVTSLKHVRFGMDEVKTLAKYSEGSNVGMPRVLSGCRAKNMSEHWSWGLVVMGCVVDVVRDFFKI